MLLKADNKNKAWVLVIFITIFCHLTITLTSNTVKKTAPFPLVHLLHWAGKILLPLSLLLLFFIKVGQVCWELFTTSTADAPFLDIYTLFHPSFTMKDFSLQHKTHQIIHTCTIFFFKWVFHHHLFQNVWSRKKTRLVFTIIYCMKQDICVWLIGLSIMS